MSSENTENLIPTGRLPTIFIGGFPKCGTTALNSILNRHLDVSGAVWKDPEFVARKYSPQKEHYFFSEKGFFKQGVDWYGRHFRTDRDHAVDATPTYVADETALRRISEIIPDAKFIVLMREPVARAFSAWNHWNQIPSESRWPMAVPSGTFEDNIKAELQQIDFAKPDEGFIGHGLYIRHVSLLESLFPRKQIFYGFSAEMRLDFHGFMGRIQEFLGITPIEFSFQEANKRDYTVSPLSKESYDWLREIFTPFDQELEQFLGMRCPWNIRA